ncbi:glycosyltransferase [Chloroflexota bacterium]
MKKVLIITYLPYASPRIPALAKYLPEFGWQPVILTPAYPKEAEPELKVVETPYQDSLRLIRRLLGIKADEDDLRKQAVERLAINPGNFFMEPLLNAAGAIVNYPDSKKGWKPLAISEGSKLLQDENIDALISSSSPVTSHIIASELKRRYKVPWLADLRDLWSQNHNYYYGPLRKLIDRRLELKTLAEADALATVSRPWADKLGRLHEGKATHIITNGFGPETMNTPPVDLTTKFTITYTGTIYTRKQNPAGLFAALKELIADRAIDPNNIEVRFYGSETSWLNREVPKYGLSGIVRHYGLVSRQSAIEKQRESQLLLLLDWDDPQEKGVYPGKIFEYLAASRPILATGGVAGNVVSKLLDETKAGIHAPTVPDIKDALKELYHEYALNGKVGYQELEPEISKYSYREIAREFAEILNHLV